LSLKALRKSYKTIHFVRIASGGCGIIAALVGDGKKMKAVMTTYIARYLRQVGDTQPARYEKPSGEAEEAYAVR
jgi:hypothetical protein